MKTCVDCGTTIPETDLYCIKCRDARIFANEAHDINPVSPPLTEIEKEWLRDIKPSGRLVIDEFGREVDSIELATRYRKDTRQTEEMPKIIRRYTRKANPNTSEHRSGKYF